MAKIPKKLQKIPPLEHKEREKEDQQAGVASTIQSHDFRFRDEKTLEGLGLDDKSRKQMDYAKKLTTKKR